MKLILNFFCFIAIFIFSSTFSIKAEIKNDKILKIGVIVPLSGEYQAIGESVLNSIRMGLKKINNERIEIYPKDNESNPEKTLLAAKELEKLGIKIVIGPIFHKNLYYLNEIENLFFLSLTNKVDKIPSNVISVGINAESQFKRIIKFIESENLSKTIILIPKSENEKVIRNALNKIKYKFFKIYSYDTDPKKLTKQIEQITKYDVRKNELKIRIKILESSELEKHKNELEKLKKRDTLGGVNFDSIIVTDFDESLKSVTTSFLYSDVSNKKIKFITLNQWFDESLFKEASTNNLYFPSINIKNYNRFKETYFINFKTYPSEISIISYDILGLIYYLNKKKNNEINSETFSKKTKFSGNLGTFIINNKSINYDLEFYKVSNNKFEKIN